MNQRNSYIIKQAFSTFFFASLASSVISQLNCLADGIILGNMISPKALSSQSLVSPIISILGIIPLMISMGSIIIAARAIGEHDESKFKRIFSVSMTSSVIIAAILSLILLFFNGQIAHLLTKDETLIPFLIEYIPFIGPILITSICSFSLVSFIKTEGNPKLVIYGTAAQFSINILLDIIMIGPLGLGIKGAAIASTCSMLGVTVVLSMIIRRSKRSNVHLLNPFREWYFPCFKECAHIGLPGVIAQVIFPVFIILTNNLAQKVAGSDGLFVISIYFHLLMVCMLIMEGASGAISAIGGILMGERDLTGFRMLSEFSMKIILIGITVLTGLMMIYPSGAAMLFGADAGSAVKLQNSIREVCFSFIPMCFLLGLSSIFIVERRIVMSGLIQTMMFVSIFAFISASAFLAPDFFWIAASVALLLLVACVICYTYKKSRNNRSLHWLTLVSMIPDDPHVDTSISYSDDSYAESLKSINRFISLCELEDSQRMKITISTEEMMYYILKEAKLTRRKGYFDVRITDSLDTESNIRSILVSIKDNGTPFCPIRTYDEKYYEQPEFEKELGLVLVNNNCSDIKYNYVNGVNCTLMSFTV